MAASVGKKSKEASEDLAEPWQARRSVILAKYTTSEKLSIVTSFLPGGEKGERSPALDFLFHNLVLSLYN